MTRKLSKDDWIRHGLEALRRQGPQALKISVMAGVLDVTRGSFYWHFRDLAEFEADLLERWESATTDAVLQDLSGARPEDRLERLISRTFSSQRGLDRAIRTWAASSPEAEAVAARADARRISHITGMLIDAGVSAERAGGRASFLYWSYVGRAMTADPDAAPLTPAEIRDLVAMFRR